MKIKFPNIEQGDLEYAIGCLEECKQDHAQRFGFNYPYFMPGGASYGAQWWQLDSSLALSGYKWVSRELAQTALLNFIESQKEDGRICLWGADDLPQSVAGGNTLAQTKGVSSLPKLFDVAYHVLQGTTDSQLWAATYNMLKRYLDWWFSARQDQKTGLITAVFEETFIPYLGSAGEYAPVDTNVEVYVGCHYTETLARRLGKTEDAMQIAERKLCLRQSINRYLWNDERGAYFPYYIKEERHSECLMAQTFFPLRMGIADSDKQKRLCELLVSDEHFNWNGIPLTSVAKTDAAFVTTKGRYQGNASWSGNVWTLINEMVVRGLCDCGENELAAALAVKTLYAFNRNPAEFINPFDGEGHGVLRYAWSASQYMELMIEVIFGVKYEADKSLVTVSPRLTGELRSERLELKELCVAEGAYIDIVIDNGVVSCSASTDNITVVYKEV